MKQVFFGIILFCCVPAYAQIPDSSVVEAKSMLAGLKQGDSLVLYQCHVEEGSQQVTTASGQTLTGTPQKYSITEKYVIVREQNAYRATYYTSSLTVFPNKKFSGLKIRERPYWLFQKEKTIILNSHDLKVLTTLEKKGREAIEYDYAITRYTTNQIIIKHRKNFKQLVIDGNYVISKLIGI